MGEIVEMMLDGILDANGEYTGNDYGHPVYPEGWFGKKKFESSYPRVKRVKDFLLVRGISKGEPQKQLVIAYGKHVNNDKPTQHACDNWKLLKAFIDNQIGYVKPSNLK